MQTQNHNSGSLKLIRASERLPAREWEGYFVHNGEYRFGSYDEGEPGQFGRPSWYDKSGRSDLKPGKVSYWLEMDLPTIPDEYPDPELKAPALEHPPLRSLSEVAEQHSPEVQSLISGAAAATDYFTEDELEAYAASQHPTLPPIPWTRKDNRLYAADGEEIVVATNASPKYRKVSNETAEAIRAKVNSHDAMVTALECAEIQLLLAAEFIHDANLNTTWNDIADACHKQAFVARRALKLVKPTTIWHSLGRPCGASANEAKGITEIPEHVNCLVCLARLVESESA